MPLPTDESPETLYDRGTVYVTHAAAVEYSEARGMSLEPARRELTWVLMDARLVSEADGSRPSKWRRRVHTLNVDVTAHVTEEPERPGLMVVVSTHTRRDVSGRRKRSDVFK